LTPFLSTLDNFCDDFYRSVSPILSSQVSLASPLE
jgi:hypothetical protein